MRWLAVLHGAAGEVGTALWCRLSWVAHTTAALESGPRGEVREAGSVGCVGSVAGMVWCCEEECVPCSASLLVTTWWGV